MDYEMFALKVPTEDAEKLDKLIQLTRTGMIPGHFYKDRSALIRAALNKIVIEVQTVLSDRQMIAGAIEKLVTDVQGGLTNDGNDGQ